MASLYKSNWEQAIISVDLGEGEITTVLQRWRQKPVIALKKIVIGCANANWHVRFDDIDVLFRVHLNAKAEIQKQMKLWEWVQPEVPCPVVLNTGRLGHWPYSIQSYLPGQNLRQAILDRQVQWTTIEAVGGLLARIHQRRCKPSGFFTDSLDITPFESPAPLADFLGELIGQCAQSTLLDSRTLFALESIAQSSACRAEPENICLVHGDFDPSNLLVHDGMPSGILDWEYAFSGAPEIDLGNFLRYAHRLPDAFLRSFLSGYTQGGGTVHERSSQLIQANTLLALLDLLVRTPPESKPIAHADILQLIQYHLDNCLELA